VPSPAIETVFGVHPGDLVTPYAFALIQGGSPGPLPDFDPSLGPVIIRAAQVAQLRALIAGYNAVIAQEAAASGAVLVDIHSVLNDLAAHGAVVGGQKLTTDFMGGLFSYDGVHPTNTGYAILANEFIKAMNRNLAAGIPPISIEQVAKTDPLIFPASHPGKRTGHVEKGMADVLRAVMAH
jgi:hypothetical protein